MRKCHIWQSLLGVGGKEKDKCRAMTGESKPWQGASIIGGLGWRGICLHRSKAGESYNRLLTDVWGQKATNHPQFTPNKAIIFKAPFFTFLLPIVKTLIPNTNLTTPTDFFSSCRVAKIQFFFISSTKIWSPMFPPVCHANHIAFIYQSLVAC